MEFIIFIYTMFTPFYMILFNIQMKIAWLKLENNFHFYYEHMLYYAIICNVFNRNNIHLKE